MHKWIVGILLLGCWAVNSLWAQDDLLALLGEEETIDYATAAFKTNRVINLHSIENTSAGVLDIKISHRFGMLNRGAYDLFGLDNATIRIGGDYGVTDRLTIGAGRSSYEKTYDGFVKYKFLRQSTGKRRMPVTAAALSSIAVEGLRWANPDRENYFSSRLNYTLQLIVGRKFSESFSLQFSPTLVHRNLVRFSEEAHDVLAGALAGRIKLSKRVALNAEYIYVLPDQLLPGYRNTLSLGFDIETGGHVFQLHFTNSTSMIEKGFVTETTGDWLDGGIHFGFNVSRVFTVRSKH
ncbi:MAG: hypothetical protein D6772_02795 [Bacteroidetes bacterium]|nr:MAG: hypothetical protein D6772_02795 [Bacteroidota bacterium]